MPISALTLRPATDADLPALRRFTGADEAETDLGGPVLLAETRGRPVAAIALRDGAVVRDPGRRTAAAVALLRAHRDLTGGDAGAGVLQVA